MPRPLHFVAPFLFLSVLSAQPVFAESAKPPFVLTETITASSARERFLAGFVEPRIVADLGFPIAGRLLSREVSVGDRVKQGDVLATLEADTLIAGVDSAQANQRIAQAQHDNATTTHARLVELAKRGVAPQAALDAAQAALDVARANVDVAHATLEQARDLLSNAVLNAPMAGVIVAVSGEAGTITGPGQAVVKLAQSHLRDAMVDLPERLVEGMSKGQRAKVALELNRQIVAMGQIREIAPSADPVTRLVRVRIALDDPPAAFRLGTTLTVHFLDMTSSLPISVAAGAIVTHGSEPPTVWIVGPDGKVRSTVIKTGSEEDRRVEVLRGLSDGDVVVIAGTDQLTDGQKVRIYGAARP